MKENKTYWIGRSKGGELYVFAEKPKKGTTKFIPASSIWHEILEEYYPEITFENSPKKLIISSKIKYIHKLQHILKMCRVKLNLQL